jgi:nitrile hydratase
VNGVHDLGGTDGLGPVPVPDSEPVFRAEWEKAAFAMFSMPFRAGFFGVDMFRYGIEQMHPAAYLLSPYYEHWMHAAEQYGLA